MTLVECHVLGKRYVGICRVTRGREGGQPSLKHFFFVIIFGPFLSQLSRRSHLGRHSCYQPKNFHTQPRGTRDVVPWPEVGGGSQPGGLKFFYFYNNIYLFLTHVARCCNFRNENIKFWPNFDLSDLQGHSWTSVSQSVQWHTPS